MHSLLFRVCDKHVSKAGSAFIFPVVWAAMLLTSLFPVSAQVVIMTPATNNLYNTGYAGTVLAGNNQVDTHYVLTNFLTTQTYQAHPLANGWLLNSHTPGSQWITIVPAGQNNTPPVAFLHATFDYQLTLTNIPVGALVTIEGKVAADDNATITANGSSPYFTNYAPKVVAGNYMTQQPFSAVTFVAGATNTILIAVSNVGGGPTGLNLDLEGSYYTALTSTVGLDIQLTPPVGLSTNQSSVLNKINQINTVGVANACFAGLTAALLGTPTSDFGSALDQLSAEKLGIFSSIAFNDASFRTSNLDDYTAHRRNAVGNLQVNPDKWDTSGLTLDDPTLDPMLAQINSRLLAWSPPRAPSGLMSDSVNPLTSLVAPAHDDPADDWNFFVSGDVILGQNFSQPDLDHTDYTTSSFQIGADYQIGNNFLVGALFDYSHTDTALDGQGSSATVDGYSPGLFASFAQDGWFANAVGMYTNNSYTEQRVINIGAFNRTADGAPTGDEEMGDLDGGYEFHSKDKRWTYGPTAGIQYTHLNVDSFSETNGCSADLNVSNEQDDSLRSRFGGRISYEMFDQTTKTVFTPFIDASWEHEYLAGSQCINSSFSEIGFGSFTVATPATSRDSALLVAGLNADISDDMTLFSNYAVQVGQSDYFGQSVSAGLKISF